MKVAMYKNGQFVDADVDWISEPTGSGSADSEAVWLESNGFGRFADDTLGVNDGFSFGVEVRQHKEREETYFVFMNTVGMWFPVLVVGMANMVGFLMQCHGFDIERRIGVVETILSRMFRVWHGHGAPIEPDDHYYGCAECDPHGEGVRRRDRELAAKARREREATS